MVFPPVQLSQLLCHSFNKFIVGISISNVTKMARRLLKTSVPKNFVKNITSEKEYFSISDVRTELSTRYFKSNDDIDTGILQKK